jgi:twitching motility protein PilU
MNKRNPEPEANASTAARKIPVSDFQQLLRLMVRKDASDLFITAGLPPSFKIDGKVTPAAGHQPLTPEQVYRLTRSLMNEQQRAEYDETLECNFAIASPEIGRFRVNVFQQKNHIGMVLRRIKTEIPTFEQLEMPQTLADLAMAKRGLVIIVGATGTGKSSTLAAMVGYRNRHSQGHIITVEDPIEFVHEHQGCIVTQREVGVDTASFEAALRNTLRQAPDLIQIGEIRNRETMEHAIAFSETGHLCLTTLHANNANQALDRILSFFPKDKHEQVRQDVSLNLKAIIAQQLIPGLSGHGRHVAVEILINTPLVAQMIHDGNVAELKSVMSRSNLEGMVTFDQALYKLYTDGKISYDDALHHADSANDLRLMVKLGKSAALDSFDSALSGVRLKNLNEI